MNNRLLIIFSVLFLLSISFFSYRYFSRKVATQPVIIYPDDSATKIKPADNQNFAEKSENTIYDNFKVKKASLRKINLLPEPEQPINITAFNDHQDNFKKQEQKNVIDPLDLILTEIMGNEQHKTIVSDDLVLPEIIAEDAQDQNVATLNISKKEEVQIVTRGKNENYKNIKVTRVNENNKLNNNYILKRDNNYFKIQLASVKSAIVGKAEGERIQKKFAKILGGLNITVQKIESEKKKVFHLVFVGPFPNISKAKAACRKLNLKGQTCTVSR